MYDKTSSVRGLTTAAAIWVSAAVGVCAGTGLYFVGLVAALSTIAILRVGKVGGFDHESREEQKERDEEEKLRRLKDQEKKEGDAAANKASKLLALEPVKVVKLDEATIKDSSPSIITPSAARAGESRSPTHVDIDVTHDVSKTSENHVSSAAAPPAKRVKIAEPLLTKYIKGKVRISMCNLAAANAMDKQ